MMEQLPVELVHLICTHMTQSALGNFRQASKYYAEVGAKCMFENVRKFVPEVLPFLIYFSSSTS